ncbi:MAG: NAD-dependent epimerase/dehydratase family protein [Reichenbachiella sp.]
MSGKSALVVGATGLVGRALLDTLLKQDYYSKIVLVGRHSPGIKDNRLEEHIVDFDKLSDYKDQISANHYYCCIGTTMDQAKSKDIFRRVDYTYPLELAQLAKEDPSCESFNVVSSYGASPHSGLFYNQVKGQMEEAIKELELETLHIYQPSLLLGYRPHFRLWEEMAKFASTVLSFFIIGSRLKFWAIKGEQVGDAMFYVATSGEKGLHIHKPLEMKSVASKKEYKGDNRHSEDA